MCVRSEGFRVRMTKTDLKELENYLEIAFDPYLIQYYFINGFFHVQYSELKCIRGRYFLVPVAEPLWYECG